MQIIDYKDFIIGALSVAMAYALFTSDIDPEDEIIADHEDDSDFGRTVILSCQTCRKQKKHREVDHNLYQCTKCKRHVDLRRKSS